MDRKHTLDEIFHEIQEEMRSQYSIGYTPTDAGREGFRKLEIKTANKRSEGPGEGYCWMVEGMSC